MSDQVPAIAQEITNWYMIFCADSSCNKIPPKAKSEIGTIKLYYSLKIRAQHSEILRFGLVVCSEICTLLDKN